MQTSPMLSLPLGRIFAGSSRSRTSTMVPGIGTPHEPTRLTDLSTGQMQPVGDVSVSP